MRQPRMWALVGALLLFLFWVFSHPDAAAHRLDEVVQYAPPAAAAAAADAQPATLVQMLAADLRAAEPPAEPQAAPVATAGAPSWQEWPQNAAVEEAAKEGTAKERSSKRSSRSSDKKKKDSGMSTAIEEECVRPPCPAPPPW